MKKNITVIDCIMGAGKTSYAIQFINDHPELSFVYCTPFLDEVTRIKEQCHSANFRDPTYSLGRKIDDFNRLLMNGENIVLTHSTFANADEDTMEYIGNNDYILIMDETLNTLENFNDVCSDQKQTVKKDDIKLLLQQQLISVDEYGKVSWIGKSYSGSKYSDVEKYAKNGTLLFLDNSLFVWEFPAQIFNRFRHVFVCTYLFDGSILKPYFEYHNLQYQKKSVKKNLDNGYSLVEYTPDFAVINRCKQLISIYDNPKANDYRGTSLSKKWYENNSDKLQILKKHLTNYFINQTKARSNEILWTCPKQYYAKLKGKGYICIRRLTQDEKLLPETERKKIEKRLSCFLSSNAKATNDFKDRSVLAYCVNMFLNPYIKKYFQKKNLKDGTQILVNEELFALSCMLQWIYRSQIRDDKEITVYIPSRRMRSLLQRWLNLEL